MIKKNFFPTVYMALTINHSDKPGKAVFINSITSCEQDVAKLKMKMTDLGWKCEKVNATCLDELRRELRVLLLPPPQKKVVVDIILSERKIKSKKKKRGYPETIIVFFFGYGYSNQLFIGESTSDSFSYSALYGEIKKVQKGDEALMVFTSVCFKKPDKNTNEHFESTEPCDEVYHICVKINGECKKGSLMTYIILNEMGDLTYEKFDKMARKLCDRINQHSQWQDDKYRAYYIYGGVSKTLFINFKPLLML